VVHRQLGGVIRSGNRRDVSGYSSKEDAELWPAYQVPCGDSWPTPPPARRRDDRMVQIESFRHTTAQHGICLASIGGDLDHHTWGKRAHRSAVRLVWCLAVVVPPAISIIAPAAPPTTGTQVARREVDIPLARRGAGRVRVRETHRATDNAPPSCRWTTRPSSDRPRAT
jgi:hypothetical protein